MSDYWLISTPSEKNADETCKMLIESVTKVKNCAAYKFYIPTFKVGTLDSLLNDADNLSKLEMYIEGLIVRLVNGLGTVLNLDGSKLREILLVDGETLHDYLVTFNWDTAKYPSKQTIRCIADLAYNQASLVENEYKQKYPDYSAIKSSCDSAERSDQGNLLTKNLTDVVSKDDFIQNSLYLATVLVVIPKKLINEWNNMYERFDDTVVPKSSRIISEDPEYYLTGVTLFQEKIPEFSDNARKFKFLVRNYKRDKEEEQLNKQKLLILKRQKQELFEPLVEMLKKNFSEMFKLTIHIKATKMFVESVLRYGLPADFRSFVIVVNRKFIKKVRDLLQNLYKHLEIVTISARDKTPHFESVAAAGHNPAEYYPYVCTRVHTDII